MGRRIAVLPVLLLAAGCALFGGSDELSTPMIVGDFAHSASGYDAASAPAAPPASKQARAELGRGAPAEAFHTDAYARIDENEFQSAPQHPLSTFGIDVDTASYANVRRFLKDGQLPPADAVRIEELVNYFPYAYRAPSDGAPFAVDAEVTSCPWEPSHRLVRIGLAARAIPDAQRPPANLVFLLDVSGSMTPPNKLPLVKSALRLLVERLREDDRVAIVVYAGASGLVLPPTPGSERGQILGAIDRLEAGGSTNGAAGIELAYRTAAQFARPGTMSRVILATDGDFNVGVTSEGELTRLIEAKAKSGVFLTGLGFGFGNLKDATMEQLADRGNGSYGYVDTLGEARKLFVEQLTGTLLTVAKDVKIQVEFNPARAAQYRLIGYENRLLAPEDFRDDTKDAGEIGAGHTVTALYEVILAGVGAGEGRPVEPLKYQAAPAPGAGAASSELLTVKLRYQPPEGGASIPLELPVDDPGRDFASASPDGRFAAAVAEFGLLLRGSPHRGQASWDAVIATAQEAGAESGDAYRREFLDMARTARALAPGREQAGAQESGASVQ